MRRQLLRTKPHIWSSKQTLGAMTFAAPDTKRKAKCFGGQGAESPHLYFRGRGSPETHSTFITANAGKRQEQGHIKLHSMFCLPGVGCSLDPETGFQ